MESRLIFSPFPSKLPHSPPPPPPPSPNIRHLPILCSSASPNNNSQHISTNNGKSKETKSPPNLSIRYRARSRRQMAKQEKKQKQEDEEEGLRKEPKPSKKKKWEEMKLSEKALEVYMGEKGLLFWLNKFAYASIFVVIGGWILFRFLGPSLGLYQLDSPPLSPSSLLRSD